MIVYHSRVEESSGYTVVTMVVYHSRVEHGSGILHRIKSCVYSEAIKWCCQGILPIFVRKVRE